MTHGVGAIWGSPSRGRRGFSLIEILIAIVVLSIGLLGLAAIFPVVIREQRIASDRILAEPAADQAEAFLKAHRVLNTPDPEPDPDLPANDPRRNLTRWERFATRSSGTTPQLFIYDSRAGTGSDLRVVDEIKVVASGRGPTLADLSLEWDLNEDPIVIPVAQRLIPGPEESGQDPRFVWDFVLYRPNAEILRAIVFVRRIDQNIRVPRRDRDDDPDLGRLTLADVLMGRYGVRGIERRIPVGVSRATGAPTNDGTGEYSPILLAQVDVVLTRQLALNAERPDLVVVDVGMAGNWPARQETLLGRVGQLIVMRSSPTELAIHRVVGVPTEAEIGRTIGNDRVVLRVEPPLQSNSIVEPQFFGYRQVFFTPQIPAAVRIVDLGVAP